MVTTTVHGSNPRSNLRVEVDPLGDGASIHIQGRDLDRNMVSAPMDLDVQGVRMLIAGLERTQPAPTTEQQIERVNTILAEMPIGSWDVVRHRVFDGDDEIENVVRIEPSSDPENWRTFFNLRDHKVGDRGARVSRANYSAGSTVILSPTTTAADEIGKVNGAATAERIRFAQVRAQSKGSSLSRVRVTQEVFDALEADMPTSSRSSERMFYGLPVVVADDLVGDWSLDRVISRISRREKSYVCVEADDAVRFTTAQPDVVEPQPEVDADVALWERARSLVGPGAAPADVLEVARWLENRAARS